MMRGPTFFQTALLLLLALCATQARAELSPKQARKLITRMAGLELRSKAVRVKKINEISASVVEMTSEIEMAFRLDQNNRGYWRVSELRSGQDKWERLDIIAQANGFDLPTGSCDSAGQFSRSSTFTELSVKRARCLVAELFGVTLPSDAVRIKEVSPLGLPLASQPSALIVALIQIDVRLGKDSRGWHAVAFRSGNRSWLNLDPVLAAIDQVKRNVATDELRTIAQALQVFRHERGFFVVSDKEAVLIDHLSPQYLVRVIRFDPWHNPYQYQGESDHFVLRSAGPDGKPNTSDDIVVSDSSH
jgi:hypothetical protein